MVQHSKRVVGGDWQVQDGEAHQTNGTVADASALIEGVSPQRSYIFEANLKVLEPVGEDASIGVYIGYADEDNYVALKLLVKQGKLLLLCKTAGQMREEQLISLAPLGPTFRPSAYHQFLVERRESEVALRVDGVPLVRPTSMPPYAAQTGLFTHNAAAAFDGIALTLIEPQG
jgi:hypothetical protein